MLCGGTFNTHASGKATDPAGAPSTGGAGGGGGGAGGGSATGGGGSRKPTPTPQPAPAPILVAPLTFVSAPDASGNVPVCSGSYRVDPYYPTLSLFTLSTQASSLNVPDGTVLYVSVVGSSYLLVMDYPMLITNGAGSIAASTYIVPGTTVQSVVITDILGDIISVGM